ncbi:hypothetical protein K490DRAFT_53776 [Saccharata proteae CBS 121410]|uniref:DUF3074 domain-containing protein n=1 Tax=Saccharata proteae CBS 121410 TaxID=1314787 RepID=A0A9P4HZR5_9PEZI|nr:hypothetical protein K490DRAFT_53776 [Saccharata proteae CBS 121410]
MAPPLGQHLRLRTLHTADLPPHPAIAPTSGTPVELFTFLKEVLDEAVTFADETIPATFKEGADKSAPPASAKVKLLSRDIKASELPESVKAKGGRNEPWFARRSVHKSDRADGTVDSAELYFALKTDHSEHEFDYTPDVFDAHKVCDWNDLITVRNGFDGGYSEVTMAIYEMCHKIPFPCANRVFSTLVITAQTSVLRDFVVAQLPVDLTDFPDADVLYANGRNRRDGEPGIKRKKVIVGEYVSVERVTATDNELTWVMATASDAKGWLPMSLQKMGVPGAVVKDVSFVVDWTQKRRNRAFQR